MQKGKRKLIGLVALLLTMLMYSLLSAEVYGTVNLTGSLAGIVFPGDQRIEMTFSLYDSATAEKPFWTQERVIDLKSGNYSTVLSSFPGYAFRDERYFLGVEVRTEKESICLGRKRLARVI